MERIFDENEKLKRAEELYFRRNNKEMISSKNVHVKPNKVKGKFLFHILLMFNIALFVFVIQNKDYVFSKEFIVNVESYTSRVIDEIKQKLYIEEINENNSATNNTYNESIVSNDGLEDVIINQPTESSLSLMEDDVKNLKLIYKFTNPIAGVVSSEFGSRESKYQNVKGYHTGIDIAAETGTPIVASMEGIVEEVSSQGDYGKHIKIRCNNVITLYAHCSEIFVKKGQIVGLGQKIAAVGNTGNSTGPHLHFEIRIDDRFVDPGKVIKF